VLDGIRQATIFPPLRILERLQLRVQQDASLVASLLRTPSLPIIWYNTTRIHAVSGELTVRPQIGRCGA